MRILIIGTGYVGLVSGACFAEMGHHVICLDIDKTKIDNLKKGIIPIYEPGLTEMVQRNSQAKRLEFTTDYAFGVNESEICFICVPTPSREDGSCNLSYVKSAAKEIALHIKNYKIIVNKSTSPVGTAQEIGRIIEENKSEPTAEFSVVSNPEFLKEGSAINDCMKPDRIIVGTDSEKAKEIMRKLYQGFTLNHDRLLFMDIRSSEMSKYAANAMLATRISFMNEMSHICSLAGADINNVRKGMGSDKRIGYSFLYAGIGYGGSCFPKDIRALSALAKSLGYETELLDAVESINNKQKTFLADKISSYFSESGGVKGKTIAFWGLSFKPDTDDIRDAPSLSLIKELQKKGAHLRLYDPISTEITKNAIEDKDNITFCSTEEEAAEMADAVALITEWKQFRLLDLGPIKQNMKGKGFFDGRNQYKKTEMEEKGFEYFGIGIPETNG